MAPANQIYIQNHTVNKYYTTENAYVSQGCFWHCTWQSLFAVYDTKPLIFIGAMFREKLVSHHQAVNIYCSIRLSLSRLCLTLYLTKPICGLWYQAFDFYRGYVSGEARLPSSSSEWSWFLSTFDIGSTRLTIHNHAVDNYILPFTFVLN